MAQTDIRTGICPKCGQVLEIPAHLEQFSCMYCGVRLTPAELQQEPATSPAASSQTAQESAAFYEAHILEVITKHTDLEQKLTRHGYTPAMDDYAEATRTIFTSLDTACSAGTLTPEQAAGQFLDQLEQRWNTSRKKLSVIRDSDKFLIAIFLIPMVRRLALPCSEAYCISLREQWLSRYPKCYFELGDFDTINGGFKKKFLGLCFITTAVCQQENKPDNCQELTAFRAFRDGYLRACEDGPALIEEYYQIAPSIVWAIEKTPDSARRYAAIRDTWLTPCLADLENGRLHQCKVRYTQMLHTLEQEYLN